MMLLLLPFSSTTFYPSAPPRLLIFPVEINSKSGAGDSPLHVALMNGSWAAAQLLLQNGADPDQLTADGNTPLHYLVENFEDEALLQGFLFRKTPLNVRNRDGLTPLGVAQRRGRTAMADTLRRHGAQL